jgi:hypothetical protein
LPGIPTAILNTHSKLSSVYHTFKTMAVIIWELSKNHNSMEQLTNTLKESHARSLIGLDCVTTEMFKTMKRMN